MMKRAALIASVLALVSAEEEKPEEMPKFMLKILEICQDELTACQENDMCHKVLDSFGKEDAEVNENGEPDCEGDEVCQAAVDCLIDNGVMDGEPDAEDYEEEFGDENRRRPEDFGEDFEEEEEELDFEEFEKPEESVIPESVMQRLLVTCQAELTVCQDDAKCLEVLGTIGKEELATADGGPPSCEGDEVCQAAVDCLLDNGVLDGSADDADFEERRRADDGDVFEEEELDFEDIERDEEPEMPKYMQRILETCQDELTACQDDAICHKVLDSFGDENAEVNEDGEPDCEGDEVCQAAVDCLIENGVMDGEPDVEGDVDESLVEERRRSEDFEEDFDEEVYFEDDMSDEPEFMQRVLENCQEELTACQEDAMCHKVLESLGDEDSDLKTADGGPPSCEGDAVCQAAVDCLMENGVVDGSAESFEEEFEEFEEELEDFEEDFGEEYLEEFVEEDGAADDKPAAFEEAGEAPGQAPEPVSLRRF